MRFRDRAKKKRARVSAKAQKGRGRPLPSDALPTPSTPRKADFTVADEAASALGAADPKAAIEDMRARQRGRKQKQRAVAKKARVTSRADDALPSPSTPKKADFTVADEAASAIGDKGRLALVERHTHQLGHVVMPEVEARNLKQKSRAKTKAGVTLHHQAEARAIWPV